MTKPTPKPVNAGTHLQHTPSTLELIKAPIADEMVEFEKKFRQFMKSRVSLLDTIMSYIVKRKGKQIRPVLVFLTAGMHGEITESTYRGAALIELLHTATLVHDDVVDDSDERRGFWSVNAIWKNKIAVLVGDYLLSRGLLLSIDNNDFHLLKIVSTAVREMSEGELLQIEKARKLDITESVYFEIIRQKTATLIAACCGTGAASNSKDEKQIESMISFGEKIGTAFQIKDDLFDFGTDDVGKPRGIDIKEKKMTLPLIYALNQASWLEKKEITFIIRYQSNKPKKVQKVIEFVRNSGGLEYATLKMNQLIDEAKATLSAYPDSAYKTSLNLLIDYIVDRKV